MKKIILKGNLCTFKNNKFKLISQVLTLILIIFVTQSHAQTTASKYRTLTGTVISAKDGKPVEGASVRNPGYKQGSLTDKHGNFTIETTSFIDGRFYIDEIGYVGRYFPFTESSRNLKISIQPINDPFLDSNGNVAPVKLGEKVPDIQFAIKNYPSSKAKISDFKGKLLILDFWTSNCSSCIASFPLMERLQKKHGDKIQIILVNVRESEEEIQLALEGRKRPIPELDRLPSIVSNKALTQLFPHPAAGNYFWIDPEGVLRLNGPHAPNLSDKKINDVIHGREITYLKSGIFIPQDTLIKLVNNTPKSPIQYSSTFTEYNNEYLYTEGSSRKIKQTDSASNTIRITYINNALLSAYHSILRDSIDKSWKSKVYGPNYNALYDAVELLVKDSSLYYHQSIPEDDQTDINVVKSLFCYEQVLPINTTEEQAMAIMKGDMERYFGLKYGTTFIVEEVAVPGYILKRIDNHLVIEKEVKRKLKHLGKREYTEAENLDAVFDRFYRPDMSKGGREPWFPYVFDEGDSTKERNIIMPVWKEGDKLEDFILALNANGLSFTKGTQKVKKIVIRDHQ